MATDASGPATLDKTPDGRTVFITSPQSRDITETAQAANREAL